MAKQRTYANFGEYLYWSYANLQMQHYALNAGKAKYDRMCYMIRSKAFKAGIPVTAQYHVDKYYLDLALFHNGKKLDIEVDGAMYHQTWTGELCYNDQLRNQALMRQGWDVMRFWVQQVRDQLPWCVEQVKKWMEQNNK